MGCWLRCCGDDGTTSCETTVVCAFTSAGAAATEGSAVAGEDTAGAATAGGSMAGGGLGSAATMPRLPILEGHIRSNTVLTLFKHWSNTGRTLVEHWSNTGLTLV